MSGTRDKRAGCRYRLPEQVPDHRPSKAVKEVQRVAREALVHGACAVQTTSRQQCAPGHDGFRGT
jgi:hypothetical protein